MKLSDVLTNEFFVQYDEVNHQLLIYRLKDGKPHGMAAITHKLSMLEKMGKSEASRWVGETLLILIPETRQKLFNESASSV